MKGVKNVTWKAFVYMYKFASVRSLSLWAWHAHIIEKNWNYILTAQFWTQNLCESSTEKDMHKAYIQLYPGVCSQRNTLRRTFVYQLLQLCQRNILNKKKSCVRSEADSSQWMKSENFNAGKYPTGKELFLFQLIISMSIEKFAMFLNWLNCHKFYL